MTTFISYNLSQKGIEKGQDQFPIFHVNPHTLTVKYTLQVIFGIVVPYTFMGLRTKETSKTVKYTTGKFRTMFSKLATSDSLESLHWGPNASGRVYLELTCMKTVMCAERNVAALLVALFHMFSHPHLTHLYLFYTLCGIREFRI